MSTRKPGKKVRGRPILPAEEVRSKRVVILLTEPEFQRLEELAIRDDESVSSTVRQIVRERLEIEQANT